jgi:hypothetical protein
MEKGFYAYSKDQRKQIVATIGAELLGAFKACNPDKIIAYFDDGDTYIRKSAYLETGRHYLSHPELREKLLSVLSSLLSHDSFRVRQTVINAAGEIGKKDFNVVKDIFATGLFDKHHSPRNAVIGSVKKMGEVNPVPVLQWAERYLHHPDKEIRREICHGIELRGRKHPEDILPMLKELENDITARVRNTLVHVLGQIAYKKGCLEKVISHLKQWKNTALVHDAIEEIIDVHHRYRNFSPLTQSEAKRYIMQNFGPW